MRLAGPTLVLRYPEAQDAPALFELARDPAVTRFFSWGPYESEREPRDWIGEQPRRREDGVSLDLLVEHRAHGPVGVTALTELSRRDRRCVLGSWFGHRFWGSGANAESKALMFHLAFEGLGMERVSAYASAGNGRSQVALERVGFRREGLLRSWHRHGDRVHDVVFFCFLRAAWERSPLRDVPVQVAGDVPEAWVVGERRG